MEIKEFNAFQLGCRQLASRKQITDPDKALLNFVLGLVGDATEVAELAVELNPRLRELGGELLKAAGNLAAFTKDNVFIQREQPDTLKEKATEKIGAVLAWLSACADAMKIPLKNAATKALEEKQ